MSSSATASDYELLRAKMRPGERLVWSGRPRGGIKLPAKGCWSLLPYAIVFIIPIIFFVALLRSGELGGVLFVSFFLLFIDAHIVNYLFIDYWRRNVTLYGLTDRQAIVIEGIFGRNVRNAPLATLTEIELKVRRDGFGTIRCIGTWDGFYRKNNRGEIKPVALFRLIADAQRVHALLLEARGVPDSPRPAPPK